MTDLKRPLTNYVSLDFALNAPNRTYTIDSQAL